MRGTAVVILAVAVLAAASRPGVAGDAAQPAGEKKIPLFNGKDLTGWVQFIPDPKVDPKTVWSVADGVIRCTGKPAGYVRTEKEYGNYRLTFEWRWTAGPGNSGCLVHMNGKDEVWPRSIEVQLASQDAGDFWVIGGTDFKEHVKKDDRRVPKMGAHNEKKPGEWNTMTIVCQGDMIMVDVNGKHQNHASAVRDDKGKPLTSGKICFQSEGAPIEFRNIVLEPLPKTL
jgi:hypothetical protein